MNQQARINLTSKHCVHNLIKLYLHSSEISQCRSQEKVRRRQLTRNSDQLPLQLLSANRLPSHYHRSITASHAGSRTQNIIFLRHQGVCMGRESSYLKFAPHRTFIQTLNILYDFHELISIKLHSTLRETVKHERVIGVGAMSDSNPHGELRPSVYMQEERTFSW